MKPLLAMKHALPVVAMLGVSLLPRPVAAQKADFNRDVLPILSAKCFVCHGPDAKTRKGDLRLDVRSEAVGSVIKPGHADQSELIARVTSKDRAKHMPPAKAGPALSAGEVQTLRAWIEQGAEYTEHWAFVPPRRPEIPEVKNTAWTQSPIDAFVLNGLEERKLKPAPRAERETLIRRLTLDVIGLPPTPAEVAAFLADEGPRAVEKVVDRLLQSPHYGERWGRHWLDVARYADSGGFETDIFYSHAWRYRDYVLRSFNADKPFDRFIREQIAGDELFPGDKEALLATGLYTIGPVLQEAGMVKGRLENDLLTDFVDTTGSAFLGLTVGCARCHDHKYDPISQKDYFGLQALFAASDLFDVKADGSRTNNNGKLAVKTTLPQFEIEQMKERVRRATDPALREQYLKKLATLVGKTNKGKGKDQSEKTLEQPSEIPTRVLAPRPKTLDVHLLKRGELDLPGEIVPPSLPAELAKGLTPEKLPTQKRRALLADWVASPKNPLTARVIVNRVWQWHFGQGLVRTPNDFGIRGDRPSHPELLDWLAVEFMENGWSLKHLHRLILNSSAYQMASSADKETLARDPDNRWLTRFQPRRLEAETIWDLQRAAAGTLDRSLYGLPFAPPLDAQEQIGNFRKWPASTPDEANRRAMYILVKRSFRFPQLSPFDLPDNVASCGQRDITTVPNQALAMLNNKSVLTQAKAFAQRLLRETDGTPTSVADLAWKYAFARVIPPDERQRVVEFLQARREAAPGVEGNRLAVEELCLALFNTNEFIYLP